MNANGVSLALETAERVLKPLRLPLDESMGLSLAFVVIITSGKVGMQPRLCV